MNQHFERECARLGAQQEDRSLRYVSSPRVTGLLTNEMDLEMATAWPFVHRAVTGRFPWESSS